MQNCLSYLCTLSRVFKLKMLCRVEKINLRPVAAATVSEVNNAEKYYVINMKQSQLQFNLFCTLSLLPFHIQKNLIKFREWKLLKRKLPFLNKKNNKNPLLVFLSKCACKECELISLVHETVKVSSAMFLEIRLYKKILSSYVYTSRSSQEREKNHQET